MKLTKVTSRCMEEKELTKFTSFYNDIVRLCMEYEFNTVTAISFVGGVHKAFVDKICKTMSKEDVTRLRNGLMQYYATEEGCVSEVQ